MNWLTCREPVSAWTHFAWMVAAIPATWSLWRLARDDARKRIGVLAFGLTLVFCYGASWLYHSVPLALARPFNKVDHIGIYLLIAGTVTPIGLIVLRGWWRAGLLGGIWSFAVAGIVLRLITHLPLNVMTFLYLVMGWIGCACYVELARNLTHARMRPLWIGGLFYSAGALLNRLGWPVLAPGVFGSHEMFHLFVMAGSAWHFWFMRTAVLTFEPVPAQVSVSEGSAIGLALEGASAPVVAS
jgi:hemolysin III